MNSPDNVITIRLDEEFFATAGEMVAFVGARLKAALEFWPGKVCGRERVINLEKYVPGRAAIYRVNYLYNRFHTWRDNES